MRNILFKETIIDFCYKTIFKPVVFRLKWKDISYCIYAYTLTFILIILVFITIPIWALKNKIQKEQLIDKNIPENNLSASAKYSLPPEFILFKNDLLFSPTSHQIIYIEKTYQAPVNNFISTHYEEISILFRNRGYYFCYIPFLNRDTLTPEAIGYYYPNLKKEEIKTSYEVKKDLNYNDLLSKTNNEEAISHSGFLRYKSRVDNTYIFSYFELTEFTEQELWAQLHTYISQIGDGTKLYSLGKPEKDEIADYNFSIESKQLVKEIKERIEKLRQIGINEMTLKSLFLIEPQLSRVLITKDYRVFLPDYNNIEIIMYPLPKALFFLFLKHPEGILFKQLPEFRNELKQIYSKLSTRVELKDIIESINNVTDPTNNAINEKCSRIREAFIKEFDESLAQYYFITGDRAEPKRISLDRALVTFESDI